MRLIDPTHGTAPRPTVGATGPARPGGTAATALCGLSNSKPGAREILEGIGRALRDQHHLDALDVVAKPSAAVGADAGMLDHLAAQYRLAVVAVGD